MYWTLLDVPSGKILASDAWLPHEVRHLSLCSMGDARGLGKALSRGLKGGGVLVELLGSFLREGSQSLPEGDLYAVSQALFDYGQ